jgi:ribosomal protein S18 acetylase RimI-like enzyme
MYQEAWQRRWADYQFDWSWLVGEEHSGALVGYALVLEQDQAWTGKRSSEAFIHRLAVAPPFRGRGIARAVMARTLRSIAASDLRFTTSLIDTSKEHSGAAMHEAFGFSPAGNVMVYYLDL